LLISPEAHPRRWLGSFNAYLDTGLLANAEYQAVFSQSKAATVLTVTELRYTHHTHRQLDSEYVTVTYGLVYLAGASRERLQ